MPAIWRQINPYKSWLFSGKLSSGQDDPSGLLDLGEIVGDSDTSMLLGGRPQNIFNPVKAPAHDTLPAGARGSGIPDVVTV